MQSDTRRALRIIGTVAVAAAVVGVVRFLLPPLLRDIFTVLLEAWAIAILAYVVFVALMMRPH